MLVTAMKEGDVFRWSYREPGDDRSYGRYHCCSRIAIVVASGRLRDTYWMIGKSFASDSRSFGANDIDKMNLTYLGNLADLEKAPEWKDDYYDDADIVNLNHSNSLRNNFYLRKGAKLSAAKMLAAANRKLERAQSDERSARRKVEEMLTAISRIEAGEIDDVYLG